jgi:hypothetical protein
MKKITLFLLAAASLHAEPSENGEDPKICVKCEKVRKWNKEHPNPYVYYDDWLKNHGEEDSEKSPFLQDQIEFDD